MQEYYVTFGVQYGTGPNKVRHPLGMTGNGYAVIEAEDYERALDAASEIFGEKFAFLYDEKPDQPYVPDGELARYRYELKLTRLPVSTL